MISYVAKRDHTKLLEKCLHSLIFPFEFVKFLPPVLVAVSLHTLVTLINGWNVVLTVRLYWMGLQPGLMR